MRLTLALVTSAMLASSAMAQSIAPELQSRSVGMTSAPLVVLAPNLAAPTPIASASIDRADLGSEPIATPIEPTLGVAAETSIEVPGAATGAVTGEERLSSTRKARTASERAEVRRLPPRGDVQPTQRYRPVASGTRDFGRFWPPVF